MTEIPAESASAQSLPASRQPPAPSRLRWHAGAMAAMAILVIGILGGWIAARQQANPVGRAGESEEAHAGEEHADAATLSPQTLENLGVRVEALALSEFKRTRDVPAVVALPPGARRPVHAPVAGIVRALQVRPGQVVRAGDVAVEILRDPFARPALVLADAVLNPLNEEFHQNLADLRASSEALAIAQEERARIRRIVEATPGGSTVPSKTEIDLGYEERRNLRALEAARMEARRHGLTDEEIARVEGGGSLPTDLPLARRVLERNRLWSPLATAALEGIPADVRDLPYTTAVLGELVGTHALTADLVRALRERPALGAAFLEVAGLVQQGWTAEALLALERAGALAPVVQVRVPEDAPEWDVSDVAVRSAARVEAGASLLDVADRRTMHLRLAPAGPDLAAVAFALATGETVEAEPLVPDSGPSFDRLRLVRMEAGETLVAHGAAYAEAPNEVLASVEGAAGPAFRTWRLREGLRYLVRVPVERLPGRFVLPADAVTARGPDSVVLLKQGRGWREVPVRVEHLDARVAVIPNDGTLYAGDECVVRGAYALSLALRAAQGTGAADPHAGHGH